MKASHTDVTVKFALTPDGDHLKGEVKADKEIDAVMMTGTTDATRRK